LAENDTLEISIADDSNSNTPDGKAQNTGFDTESTKEAYRTLSVSDYDATKKITTITANSSGVATGTVYLEDGQYVVVRGVPIGASYSIKEDKEDYKQTHGAAALITDKSFTDGTYDSTTEKITGTIAKKLDNNSQPLEDQNYYTGFTNNLNGVIPTGILLTYTPFIIISVIAVAGIIFLAVRRRRNAE
ncbi:MAG: QVPTGV class sortase B protein-sorting domain-containing protein, partial [Oscillospiraceae bacterium]|nr:QVPTGV class sortase B protein-sorting domain-containing protein [Oscillospiraceae bacterium]